MTKTKSAADMFSAATPEERQELRDYEAAGKMASDEATALLVYLRWVQNGYIDDFPRNVWIGLGGGDVWIPMYDEMIDPSDIDNLVEERYKAKREGAND